jgi:hypothetical protein
MNGSQSQNDPQTQAAQQDQPAQPIQQPPMPSAVMRGLHQDPRTKSVPLACFLSAMPGLGQVYTGFYTRGFVNAVTFAGIITILTTGDLEEFTPFFALFLAFFWLHNIIDAGRRATFYNQMLAGGDSMDSFSPELKMPGSSGSILAGAALIVGGLIALSYTRFDMSLVWVEDWWPVGPILGGAYLVFLAIRDRSNEK